MSTHKSFDKICCVVLALCLLLTVLFVNGEHFGIKKASTVPGYEKALFDTSKVHTIDIIMDDWDEFTQNCRSEEYYNCTIVIDNEAYKNVAIRGKGNTSLSSVTNDRYSYKIEFDHYDSTSTYYGLDKLCLNNIIQDNTYMKDYLTYRMMNDMGVAAPLCSYVNITVNGEPWGLYLAVEGVEESFLQRNYGKDYGELYKPDSMNMGGGRGNGNKFDMDAFLEGFGTTENSSQNKDNEAATQSPEESTAPSTQQPAEEQPSDFDWGNIPEGMTPPDFGGQIPEGMTPPDFGGQMPEGMTPPDFGGEMPEGMTPPVSNMSKTSSESNSQQGDRFAGMTPPDFGGKMPEGMTPPDFSGQMPEGMSPSDFGSEMPENFKDSFGGGFGGKGSSDAKLQYIDDNADSYSTIFESAKTDITNADKTRLIEALKNLGNKENLADTVDIEAVIRYFVVHNFVVNSDSYTGSMIHNYYLYEKDGQLQMIPWDYNLAFGSFMSMGNGSGSVNDPIDTPLSVNGSGDRPMIDWIFSSEEYTELYHQYFNEFIEKYFDSGYFEEMIDSTRSMISSCVESDPTKFCSFEEFEKGADTLKEFCLLRAESVKGQLDGTIGSTSDTQKSETLIDAGDLNISAMGTMGGMGGGMKRPDSNIQKPSADSETTENSSNANGSRPQMPGNFQAGARPDSGTNESGNEQGNSDFKTQRPSGGSFPNSGEAQTQSISTSTAVMIGISVLILGLGLVVVLKFKRRK